MHCAALVRVGIQEVAAGLARREKCRADAGAPARVDVALVVVGLGREGLGEDLGLAREVHLASCRGGTDQMTCVDQPE